MLEFPNKTPAKNKIAKVLGSPFDRFDELTVNKLRAQPDILNFVFCGGKQT
jgi:hypothetical protein